MKAPRIRQKHVASRIARSRGSTRSTDSGFWAMSPPQICHPSQIGTSHPRSDNGIREEDRRSGNGASVDTRDGWCQCTFTRKFSRDERAQICTRTSVLVMSPGCAKFAVFTRKRIRLGEPNRGRQSWCFAGTGPAFAGAASGVAADLEIESSPRFHRTTPKAPAFAIISSTTS